MRTPSGGRARTGALAVTLAGSALLLAGCIDPPVTASGTGTVTISWAGSAEAYDPVTELGNALLLCESARPTCDDPAAAAFVFYPDQGSSAATLSPGVQVGPSPVGSAARLGLPAGSYTLQAWGAGLNVAQRVAGSVGDPLSITIGGERDLTTWLQSVARPSADAACPRGYTPSWDAWPNDGAGGFVCNRTVYAYYPDEPVRGPGWDSAATQWQWSVERAGADAPCPDGFDPSWAQWPRDGAGGYVCVGLAE